MITPVASLLLRRLAALAGSRGFKPTVVRAVACLDRVTVGLNAGRLQPALVVISNKA